MKRILSILLSAMLLFGMISTVVCAAPNEEIEVVRDISGVGGAIDIAYKDGKYYAITPTSILVSPDAQGFGICYENTGYRFSGIETLNNQLVITSHGQSYSEASGTRHYTNILTSSDGINFTAHQTIWKNYNSIAFYNGVYYLSYHGSDGYYVDSTADFESFAPAKIFTGEYYSTPQLISDNNGLYLYSSGISGTLLYRFTDGAWSSLDNNTGIVAREINSVDGLLYGVMIKKHREKHGFIALKIMHGQEFANYLTAKV